MRPTRLPCSLAFVLLLAAACGDDPVGSLDVGGRDLGAPDRGVDAGISPSDSGPTDLGARDEGPRDMDLPDIVEPIDAGPADGEPEPDAGPSCIPDVACTDNPSAPCQTGRVSCDTGAAVCVDDAQAADGTSCTDGACVAGLCLPPTVLSADLNLSTDAVTANRSCAEAPQYSVVALTDTEATLTSTPSADCLAPGDEVLLINLQGAPGEVENVGVWERLEVAQVSPLSVQFASPKTRFFGAASNSDEGIGTEATEQKVALIRIPRFGELVVSGGTTLSAAPWDGALGGVLAFRAAGLEVEGTISAAGLGYRPGRWSRDSQDCDDNVTTEAGESIAGPGPAQTARNVGGPGGIEARDNLSFNGNTPVSASAGHALPGEAGLNPNGRTLGEPGEAYGVSDGTRLTMGSGSSGNLTCDVNQTQPVLMPFGIRAGGIVLVFSGDIWVGATGSISADAPTTTRDVASSGGYVLLQGANVTLGDEQVSARGAVAQSINVSGPVLMNNASPGYVVIEHSGTVTGTTTPSATLIAR